MECKYWNRNEFVMMVYIVMDGDELTRRFLSLCSSTWKLPHN